MALKPATLALLALVVVPGAPARAALASDASSCLGYERQVDLAIAQRATAPRIDAAKARRERGAQACAEGRHRAGIGEFRLALRELGVKPTAP